MRNLSLLVWRRVAVVAVVVVVVLVVVVVSLSLSLSLSVSAFRASSAPCHHPPLPPAPRQQTVSRVYGRARVAMHWVDGCDHWRMRLAVLPMVEANVIWVWAS